ncbi:MAG TPA: ABC transporter permease subunit [Thermoanaerobaculia bacterium]|nr:ABC transporter permease subunit [Thermoanaerobaculia bacterium]
MASAGLRRLRRWRDDGLLYGMYGVTAALAIVVVLPVAVVVAGSCLDTSFLGLSSEQWVSGGRDRVSFKWFLYVIELYGGTMLFSLRLALLSVGVCLGAGVTAAYVLVRRPFRGSRLLEEIVLLPLSLPGIGMSVALIQAWSVVRGQWWLILGGHLLYTLPFMVRAVTNTLRSFDVARLEAAARTLGAGTWQRATWVVLPNLRHAMVVGSLLVFAISWGEFNVSFLLNTPLHQTFPAALYATYTANSFQVSSAATVLFLAVVVPALVAIQLAGGRDLVEQGV